LLSIISGVYVHSAEAGVEVTTENSIFIPHHLRVLQVAQQVQCLDESVADNVFFGVRSAKRGAKAIDLDKKVLERGYRICRRLQFPHRLLRSTFHEKEWDEKAKRFSIFCLLPEKFPANNVSEANVELSKLTSSERKLIHIARALIFNPEVLVSTRPESSSTGPASARSWSPSMTSSVRGGWRWT
jgi:ABC-type iron transport system FetAB ATPase subunit